MLLAASRQEEPQSALYVIRLGAFVLILLGILDKNRSRSQRT